MHAAHVEPRSSFGIVIRNRILATRAFDLHALADALVCGQPKLG
jgi:hypothetical protein